MVPGLKVQCLLCDPYAVDNRYTAQNAKDPNAIFSKTGDEVILWNDTI
jgi:hypothetical protein